jgi:FkbM family methyltransferase
MSNVTLTAKLLSEVSRFWKVRILREPLAVEMARFWSDRANERFVESHPLHSDSIVYDVGGYTGGWSERLYHKYNCRIEIFEPMPQFCERLRLKFEGNRRIEINPFGLWDENGTSRFAERGDESHLDELGRVGVECRLRQVDEVILEKNHSRISLMAMNIEGAEYRVIPRLISSGLMSRIDNLMVQFHRISGDSPAARQRICEALRSTHTRTFCYDYIWENWRLR